MYGSVVKRCWSDLKCKHGPCFDFRLAKLQALGKDYRTVVLSCLVDAWHPSRHIYGRGPVVCCGHNPKSKWKLSWEAKRKMEQTLRSMILWLHWRQVPYASIHVRGLIDWVLVLRLIGTVTSLLPSTFIQPFGDPTRSIENTPLFWLERRLNTPLFSRCIWFTWNFEEWWWRNARVPWTNKSDVPNVFVKFFFQFAVWCFFGFEMEDFTEP